MSPDAGTRAVPGMASGDLGAADRLRAAAARGSYRPGLLPHPHQVLAMRALHGEDGCDRARRRQVQHWRLITLSTRAEGLAMRPTMSAELSRRVTDAAAAAAVAVAVAVVTVDGSGVLKELRRMDGLR